MPDPRSLEKKTNFDILKFNLKQKTSVYSPEHRALVFCVRLMFLKEADPSRVSLETKRHHLTPGLSYDWIVGAAQFKLLATYSLRELPTHLISICECPAPLQFQESGQICRRFFFLNL